MNKKLMVFGVVGAAVFAQQASARDFTIAAWGGVYQDAQREAHFKPFAAKEGISFTEATYLGGLAEIKGMSDTGQVTWDVVMGGKDTAQTACDEGLVEEIDLVCPLKSGPP